MHIKTARSCFDCFDTVQKTTYSTLKRDFKYGIVKFSVYIYQIKLSYFKSKKMFILTTSVANSTWHLKDNAVFFLAHRRHY